VFHKRLLTFDIDKDFGTLVYVHTRAMFLKRSAVLNSVTLISFSYVKLLLCVRGEHSVAEADVMYAHM
jgi:hypothetical protein